MANFSSLFKEEVSRIARKELRKSIEPMRKQLAAQRRDIAAIKRERDQLKRTIARMAKTARPSGTGEQDTATDEGSQMRFSAARLRSLRKRLGLSAENMAYLGGFSAQSVYNWEHGKSRPRAAQLERIAAFRKLGKRKLQQMLAEHGKR